MVVVVVGEGDYCLKEVKISITRVSAFEGRDWPNSCRRLLNEPLPSICLCYNPPAFLPQKWLTQKRSLQVSVLFNFAKLYVSRLSFCHRGYCKKPRAPFRNVRRTLPAVPGAAVEQPWCVSSLGIAWAEKRSFTELGLPPSVPQAPPSHSGQLWRVCPASALPTELPVPHRDCIKAWFLPPQPDFLPCTR